MAPVVGLRLVGAGADDDAVGPVATGDEGLGAVEDVVRAVLGQLGRRGHAGEVGAAPGSVIAIAYIVSPETKPGIQPLSWSGVPSDSR